MKSIYIFMSISFATLLISLFDFYKKSEEAQIKEIRQEFQKDLFISKQILQETAQQIVRNEVLLNSIQTNKTKKATSIFQAFIREGQVDQIDLTENTNEEKIVEEIIHDKIALKYFLPIKKSNKNISIVLITHLNEKWSVFFPELHKHFKSKRLAFSHCASSKKMIHQFINTSLCYQQNFSNLKINSLTLVTLTLFLIQFLIYSHSYYRNIKLSKIEKKLSTKITSIEHENEKLNTQLSEMRLLNLSYRKPRT